MKRSAVNPWEWNANFGYSQAELIENPSKQLVISGQTAVDENGNIQKPDDMRAQVILAMDNLEAVLAEAGMSLSDVARIGVYSTDMDAFMANYDVIAERLGAAQIRPAMSVIGIARLVMPDMLIEIEATAFK